MSLFDTKLTLLSNKYKIDRNELLDDFKYLMNNEIGYHKENNNIKVNMKTNLDTRCQAYTKNGNQCSRTKKYHNFCGLHYKQNKPEGYKDEYNDEYLETWIDDDLGPDYLVDSNNFIYTNNVRSPVIIGIKCPDGNIKQFSLKDNSITNN